LECNTAISEMVPIANASQDHHFHDSLTRWLGWSTTLVQSNAEISLRYCRAKVALAVK
jgi:hypothetical protein